MCAARLPVDKWGDPFIMLLVVIALLWRCKTVSESCITGGFLLIYFAKLLLRLLAPEVSLQYRAGVVSTMRGVMILCALSHIPMSCITSQYQCTCVLANFLQGIQAVRGLSRRQSRRELQHRHNFKIAQYILSSN